MSEATRLDRVLGLVQQVWELNHGDVWTSDRDLMLDLARQAWKQIGRHSNCGVAARGLWVSSCIHVSVGCPDRDQAFATLAAVEAWARRHGAVGVVSEET